MPTTAPRSLHHVQILVLLFLAAAVAVLAQGSRVEYGLAERQVAPPPLSSSTIAAPPSTTTEPPPPPTTSAITTAVVDPPPSSAATTTTKGSGGTTPAAGGGGQASTTTGGGLADASSSGGLTGLKTSTTTTLPAQQGKTYSIPPPASYTYTPNSVENTYHPTSRPYPWATDNSTTAAVTHSAGPAVDSARAAQAMRMTGIVAGSVVGAVLFVLLAATLGLCIAAKTRARGYDDGGAYEDEVDVSDEVHEKEREGK